MCRILVFESEIASHVGREPEHGGDTAIADFGSAECRGDPLIFGFMSGSESTDDEMERQEPCTRIARQHCDVSGQMTQI